VYVVVSFVEGNILVPRSAVIRLRPALVGPVITIGWRSAVRWRVLAVPTASAARDIYLYLFRRAAGAAPRVALAPPERPPEADASTAESPRAALGASPS
jgi:hypothetical protein